MTTHFLPKWSEDIKAVSRSVRRSTAGLVPDDQFDRLVVLASLFVVGQDRADRSIETPTTASARASKVYVIWVLFVLDQRHRVEEHFPLHIVLFGRYLDRLGRL